MAAYRRKTARVKSAASAVVSGHHRIGVPRVAELYPVRYSGGVVEVRQTEAFARWFGGLRDRQARARILARIRRLSLGNRGDVKPVGDRP